MYVGRNLTSVVFWAVLMLVGPVSYGADRPIVREEVTIMVDGIEEQWRLEWKAPPVSVCGPGRPNPIFF